MLKKNMSISNDKNIFENNDIDSVKDYLKNVLGKLEDL